MRLILPVVAMACGRIDAACCSDGIWKNACCSDGVWKNARHVVRHVEGGVVEECLLLPVACNGRSREARRRVHVLLHVAAGRHTSLYARPSREARKRMPCSLGAERMVTHGDCW